MKNLGRVYISASKTRKYNVGVIERSLIHIGVSVCSSWHRIPYFDESDEQTSIKVAMECWQQLMMADTLILLTEGSGNYEEPTLMVSGGRHVEFGAAYAIGKKCIIIGKPDNIFQRLSNVDKHNDFYDFMTWLTE